MNKNNAIRVLHVVHSMDCGGSENFIMNLYRAIDKSKVQFDFLVHTNKKGYFDDEITKLGGNIYHVSYFNVLNSQKYKAELHSFYKKHPEIQWVHGHLGSCAHIYLDIAKKHNKKTIVHCHSGKPYFMTPKNVLYLHYTKKVRSIADYFMSCNKEGGIYRYGEKITSNPNKYMRVNNAIDLNKYKFNETNRKKIQKEFHLKDDDILIGHVGSFTKVKNHKFLIKIVKELLNINKNIKCILVGDGPLLNSIKNYVQKNDLSDNVIFTCVRNDIEDIMQRMDAVVFPSLREGVPLTLIEAQAASLSCLISSKISTEVKQTNLIHFEDITKSPKIWAAKLIEISNTKRPNNNLDNLYNNYNIDKQKDYFEKFYTE